MADSQSSSQVKDPTPLSAAEVGDVAKPTKEKSRSPFDSAHRAPLFSVALAFACGCVAGLSGVWSLAPCLLVWAIGAVGWWQAQARRQAAGTLLLFYLFVALSGLAYTVLRGNTIAADDLRRLPAESRQAITTQWRGTLLDDPTPISATLRHGVAPPLSARIAIDAWRPTGGRYFRAQIEAPWQTAHGIVFASLTGLTPLRGGDEIEFAAALQPLAPSPLPGQFDRRLVGAEQGIYFEVTLAPLDWRRVSVGTGPPWRQWARAARDWTYGQLQIGLEDDPATADFLAGMLIGFRQQIPLEIENDFRRTGTLHVFAVSGQNIAELLVVAVLFLQVGGLVRWRWGILLTPLILSYCLLTGAPASAIRATVMALAVLLAWRLGRPLRPLACWSLAFLAMMVWQPMILLDPGAQLSFAVVLGLILLTKPLQRQLVRAIGPDPLVPRDLLSPGQRREEQALVAVTYLLGSGIAVFLVTEPITILDFHQFTPISILANLVVVPCAGLITAVGTLSVGLSVISRGLAVCLNNANWLFARLLILFVGWLAHEPGAAINVPDLRVVMARPPQLIVAPLGKSGCLLVRAPGAVWLVNSGRDNGPTPPLERLLRYYGVNRLDGLILAQISQAENGGASTLVHLFSPGRVVVPVLRTKSPVEKEVLALARTRGQPLETWQAGQSFALGPAVQVKVLNPSPDNQATQAENRALVLLFQVGNQRLLWAGKLDATGQAEILRRWGDLRPSVWVMSPDAIPSVAWLQAMGSATWLQLPRRDPYLNPVSPPNREKLGAIWPLAVTGTVELQFAASSYTLMPWLGPPDRP